MKIMKNDRTFEAENEGRGEKKKFVAQIELACVSSIYGTNKQTNERSQI